MTVHDVSEYSDCEGDSKLVSFSALIIHKIIRGLEFVDKFVG